MKKLFTLLPLCLALALSSRAQIFWVENFESGSTTGLEVTSYTGWSVTVTGTEGATPNLWYVSCAENGHTTGICGSGCVSASATATGATLHISSNAGTFGDNGASYDAGGLCSIGFCPQTDRRANSPTINCTGKYGIRLSFYYIENGQGAIDDGSVFYSADGGSTWSLLVNTPKTTVCGSGQGQWDRYTMMLPSSADNNPNVKIGFRWVNNDDATGTDPSFAIDSVSLSTSSSASAPVASFTAGATTVCEDSCIRFISTTTGTVDSMRWVIPGVTISGATNDTLTACFPIAGTFSVQLFAYNGTSLDSASRSVVISPAPDPAVNHVLNTITVIGTYPTYQWYKNGTIIAGATTNTYTYTLPGTYLVVVDSAGCKGSSTPISNLDVRNIAAAGNTFTVAQASQSACLLTAAGTLEAELKVQVLDGTGRLVATDSWEAGTTSKQINTGNWGSGLYLIRLSGNNTAIVLKWMKQ